MPPAGGRNRIAHDSPASQGASHLSSETVDRGPSLLNTTFSPYRVSPLYVGSKHLDQNRPSALAKRLRDLLVGDVVRGVEVGLDGEDNVMARAGVLEAVDFGWSSLGSILSPGPDVLDGTPEQGTRRATRNPESDSAAASASLSEGGLAHQRLKSVPRDQALHISIRYERAVCVALLLPQLEADNSPSAEGGVAGEVDGGDMFQQVSAEDLRSGSGSSRPMNPSHFRHLPLLLVRMPAQLRSVVIDFLSGTFDCRISPLRLGTRTLLTNLERWIAASRLMGGPVASKDVVISLGFPLPVPLIPDLNIGEPRTSDPGLRSLDVIIPASDIQRFCVEGVRPRAPDAVMSSERELVRDELALKRRKGDVNTLEEGWDWRYKNGPGTGFSTSTAASYPFTEALGRYLDEHMALNLFDSRTRITKIACGGFTMSESRLKFFSTPENDLGRDAEHPTSIPHTQAVIDCLGDLLGRATARF